MIEVYKIFHQKNSKSKKVYMCRFYTFEDAAQYVEEKKNAGAAGSFMIEKCLEGTGENDR